MSELLNRTGVEYVGPLPPDIQNITTYASGLHPAAPEAAKALVEFLTSPSAASVVRKIGMEPG